jgi:hypothetical protein
MPIQRKEKGKNKNYTLYKLLEPSLNMYNRTSPKGSRERPNPGQKNVSLIILKTMSMQRNVMNEVTSPG